MHGGDGGPARSYGVEWNETADRVFERMQRLDCTAMDVMENDHKVGVCQRSELERRAHAGEWLGALAVVDVMLRVPDEPPSPVVLAS